MNYKYTVKDIADQLDVAKPTVRKYFSQLPQSIQESESKTVMGTLMLTPKAMQLVAEKIGKTLENKDNNDNVENSFPQTSEIYQEKVKTLEKHIETLENQLNLMSEQLKNKDIQIDKLATLLDQEQQLHKSLQDKQRKLPESPETIDIKRLTNYL